MLIGFVRGGAIWFRQFIDAFGGQMFLVGIIIAFQTYQGAFDNRKGA